MQNCYNKPQISPLTPSTPSPCATRSRPISPPRTKTGTSTSRLCSPRSITFQQVATACSSKAWAVCWCPSRTISSWPISRFVSSCPCSLSHAQPSARSTTPCLPLKRRGRATSQSTASYTTRSPPGPPDLSAQLSPGVVTRISGIPSAGTLPYDPHVDVDAGRLGRVPELIDAHIDLSLIFPDLL